MSPSALTFEFSYCGTAWLQDICTLKFKTASSPKCLCQFTLSPAMHQGFHFFTSLPALNIMQLYNFANQVSVNYHLIPFYRFAFLWLLERLSIFPYTYQQVVFPFLGIAYSQAFPSFPCVSLFFGLIYHISVLCYFQKQQISSPLSAFC